MELIDNLRLSFPYWIDCNLKSTKKLIYDIRDSVDKPKNLSNCMFPLANLHEEKSLQIESESILFNQLIILYICPGNLKIIRSISIRSLNIF